MLPVGFDHDVLSGLPLPDKSSFQRLADLLKANVARRVMPDFRKRQTADATRLAAVADGYAIARLEDPGNRLRAVTLLTRDRDGWSLHIHERVFDYLAFVMPTDPHARLADTAPEQRRALAFVEFLLRHECAHMILPDRDEGAVVRADAAFAMRRRQSDPTYYRTLREALSDEMNGLKGEDYLALLDGFEGGDRCEALIARMVDGHIRRLADAPEAMLRQVFPRLSWEYRSGVARACYEGSRSPGESLVRRARWFRTLLGLFQSQLLDDRKGAEALFNMFRDDWNDLLREAEVPVVEAGEADEKGLFERFTVRLGELTAREAIVRHPPRRTTEVAKPELPIEELPQLSLKDRVEAARKDPRVPRSVMTIIDKNISSAHGHSGTKYTELIETLLALPWGRFSEIRVSPQAFTAGLDASHYGLEKPKEILADIFSNLIWRYRRFSQKRAAEWRRSGSTLLFVGPPGVGKTSLAISAARNLGIPFHKLSLGGMRDESDLRGHGFTYEGSKPGAIVQGLIKMDAMNGMFIMDEADKTEKFAIATLLEILDPEQNHLYHDKYVSSTIDIDLSNSHFILTANTLETVPPPVADRCEIVFLDRYSIDEKVAIAENYLIPRVREKSDISEDMIFFDPEEKEELLRHLVTHYTREAGVRQLERVIRTLFLRVHRKEVAGDDVRTVRIVRETVKRHLQEPPQPRRINPDDRVGEVIALGVDVERGIGSIIPIQATGIPMEDGDGSGRSYLSMVEATGNIERVMDESRRVATTGILHCASQLNILPESLKQPVHLHFMGASSRKDGPSAGGAIALALTSLLTGVEVRRDVAVTGEIDTQGRITGIGGLDVKLETAFEAGCTTAIIPLENLHGETGVERFPAALKKELQVLTYDEWKGDHPPFDYGRHVLQVVAVDHITQAAEIALIDRAEIARLEDAFADHARALGEQLAPSPHGTPPRYQLVLVKRAEELPDAFVQHAFCKGCPGCRLLVTAAAADEVRLRFPPVAEGDRLTKFDAGVDDVADEVGEKLAALSEHSGGEVELAVTAPFFLFRKRGFMESVVPGGKQETARLFANNYTVQGVKIKKCKPTLNMAVCYLARLSPEELENCPFLGRLDGVHVVDLSFIPEKYCLDIPRAENILNRCLGRWIAELETAVRQLDEPAARE